LRAAIAYRSRLRIIGTRGLRLGCARRGTRRSLAVLARGRRSGIIFCRSHRALRHSCARRHLGAAERGRNRRSALLDAALAGNVMTTYNAATVARRSMTASTALPPRRALADHCYL